MSRFMLPAMVLCAGFGTRLRPLTNFFPKPLLPIGDRPAFVHIIDALRAANCAPLAINIHHQAETFDAFVPSGVSVLHEPHILGTAGGVANAAHALGPGDVLVWNGDMQLNPHLPSLVEHHRARHDSVATLLVASRPAGQGTVGVGANGRIARLRGESFCDELGGADYLGIIVLSPSARHALPQEGCLVGDVLMPMLRQGLFAGVALHGNDWVDIGTPERFLEANLRWLRARGLSFWSAENAHVAPSVSLTSSVVAQRGEVRGAGLVEECVVLPGGALTAPARRSLALPDGSVVALDP